MRWRNRDKELQLSLVDGHLRFEQRDKLSCMWVLFILGSNYSNNFGQHSKDGIEIQYRGHPTLFGQ